MKFLGSIAFKIWISCTVVLLLVLLFFSMYYPYVQGEELTAFKRKEIQETTNSLALAVKLSLAEDDFQGLKKTLSRAQEKEDFEYVAVITTTEGKDEVLTAYPALPAYSNKKNNAEHFIIEESPFQSESFKGKVVVSFSKKNIDDTVKAMNRPIYLAIVIIFFVSLIIFSAVASIISRPVRNLTRFAQQLADENYNEPIPVSHKKNEISKLNNTIAALQERLISSRERNIQLTDGLEEEIRKRTAELENSTQRLIDAQQTAKIGNFEYLFASKKWKCSSNIYSFLGLTEEEGLGSIMALWDAENKDELKKTLLLISKEEAENSSLTLDLRFKKKNSEAYVTLLLTARISVNEDGQTQNIVGTLQDISYRKKIEIELQELSLVAKNATNCVVITDEKQRIKWVNESLLNLTGYSLEEVIGQTPKMFQYDKTNSSAKSFIREKLREGLDVQVEIQNRGKNGNEYWLELNIVSIRDKHNKITGYIAIETDITTLKNSQEEIKRINESLENRVLENTRKNLDLSRMIVEQEKLATIGEISAGIAHDLNTPLGAAKVGAESLNYVMNEFMQIFPSMNSEEQQLVIGLSETIKPAGVKSGLLRLKEQQAMEIYLKGCNPDWLVELPQLTQKLSECNITIDQSEVIEKMVALPNTMVCLSALYQLQMLHQLMESISISTERAINVVKDVRAFINKGTTPVRQDIDLRKNIQVVLNIFNHELRKQVQLETNLPEGITIQGFDVKLFQLWSNLIKNALDAMEECHEKRLTVEVKTLENGRVSVCVSNNGPKIPEEIQTQIFKKFFSTKREKNGTGLGLSIVKNVVDEHHAHIRVESTEERTSFYVEFPTKIG
jgi:PAS domain S-box-containing protein